MIWLIVLVGIILLGVGVMMAIGQFPSIGGTAMAWILMFIGFLVLAGAYISWATAVV